MWPIRFLSAHVSNPSSVHPFLPAQNAVGEGAVREGAVGVADTVASSVGPGGEPNLAVLSPEARARLLRDNALDLALYKHAENGMVVQVSYAYRGGTQ